ncbi:MAG: lipopolysaccharide biosynthesis protein, partial [Prevotella sp.]|nr:lipopolysaccharide biosynthesis protein [Prevotella sp.]
MSESANNKRIANNTLILYVRMLFTMFITFYTSRLVLKGLGVEDYGIYNVVGGFVSMFGFLNAAMVSSTQRYLNYELGKGNHKRLHEVFVTS